MKEQIKYCYKAISHLTPIDMGHTLHVDHYALMLS